MEQVNSARSLACFIKEARKKRGLNQDDVGKSVGLRQATISKIENASDGVKLETMFRVISFLGYDMYLKSKKESEEEPMKKWTEEW